MKPFRSKKLMIALITILVISFVGLSANALASSSTADEPRKTEAASLPVYIHTDSDDHAVVAVTAGATVSATAQTLATTAPATQETVAQTPAPSDQTAPLDQPVAISIDRVKQIVLEKVPGAVITELDLDECDDDCRLTYDVEATLGQTEYDFEIDAYTGVILEFETEIEDDLNEVEDDLNEVDDDLNEVDDDIDEVDNDIDEADDDLNEVEDDLDEVDDD
jgi:uncharacterized membrane protein YkoI